MSLAELKSFAREGHDENTRVQPKWQTLVRRLSAELMQGNYQPGEILPSENHLAKTTGFARSTVRQAFAQLEKEGFIKRVQGKGTIVSSRKQNSYNGQKLEMFGLIMPGIRRTLYLSLIKGFDRGATQDHHQVMICNTDNSVDKQGNIILQLLDKGVVGVSLVPTTRVATPLQHIRYLQSNHIPVVFCHRPVEGVDAPCITWDGREVGRIAGKALAAAGHRDILYFGVYRYRLSQAHEYGLRHVLEAEGLTLPAHRVLYGPPPDEDEEGDQKEAMLRDALAQPDRPTAILCSDDTEAERAYWVAMELGLRVPEDLSIVGFGDIHRDTIFRKQLTSVVVDELELGHRAARLLRDMSAGEKPIEHSETHFMELQLHRGRTLAER